MLRETPVEKVYQKYYDFTSPNRIGLVVTELGALTVVQTSDQASLAMANCPPKLQWFILINYNKIFISKYVN